MFICVCNAVTDREIRACAELGASSLDELREHLGVARSCGRCAESVKAVLDEACPHSSILPHHHST